MVTCNISDGLANNLFQIGAALSLAHREGVEARFATHDWKYASIFDKPLPQLRPEDEVGETYQETHFHYADLPYWAGINLRGYYQSEKYLNADTVRSAFVPSADIRQHLMSEIDRLRIDLHVTHPVAVHVRRGDYLQLSQYHPVLPVEYYNEAMDHFPDRSFVVFSDDPEWCAQAIKGIWQDRRMVLFHSPHDFIDLYLMSQCEDFIIANSTYSWWGAWLNPNPNKTVIAPKQWFGPGYDHHSTEDIVPDNWVKI